MHISSHARTESIFNGKNRIQHTRILLSVHHFVVLLTTTFIHIRLADCITVKLCIRLHLLSTICTCRTMVFCCCCSFCLHQIRVYCFITQNKEFFLSSTHIVVWILAWLYKRIGAENWPQLWIICGLRFSIAWIRNMQLASFCIVYWLELNDFTVLHEMEQMPNAPIRLHQSCKHNEWARMSKMYKIRIFCPIYNRHCLLVFLEHLIKQQTFDDDIGIWSKCKLHNFF